LLARRIGAQALFHELDAELGVLVPERPARPEVAGKRRALRGRLRALQRFALRLEDDVRTLLLDEQSLVERRDVPVRRIRSIRARENPFDLLRSEPPGDARCTEEESALRASAGSLVCLPEQRRDTLFPLPRTELGVEEALRQIGITVRELDGSRVVLGGPLVIPHVEEHVAELGEQRHARRRVLRVLELKLEELLHHVELAELPVDGSGLAQGGGVRGVELVSVLEVLQGAHALQETRVEEPSEAQVVLGFLVGLLGRDDALLERLDDPIPVVQALKLLKSLL